MARSLKDQTIAFAGVLQAGELVRQIADSGQCSQQAARYSLDSLFETSPESTAAVFGGVDGVNLGLTIAREMAAGGNREVQQAMAYASGLLRLSMLLRRDPGRQQELARGLELVEPVYRSAGDALDPSVVAQLADVYSSVISTLSMRIQVHGRPTILKQTEKVALIRAILLAGVRAGFLWFQLGGRPWRLLFQRGRMLRLAGELAR